MSHLIVRPRVNFQVRCGKVNTKMIQYLSVEELAAKACGCSHHFSRKFKDAFGKTPAAFVEGLAIERRSSAFDHT